MFGLVSEYCCCDLVLLVHDESYITTAQHIKSRKSSSVELKFKKNPALAALVTP